MNPVTNDLMLDGLALAARGNRHLLGLLHLFLLVEDRPGNVWHAFADLVREHLERAPSTNLRAAFYLAACQVPAGQQDHDGYLFKFFGSHLEPDDWQRWADCLPLRVAAESVTRSATA